MNSKKKKQRTAYCTIFIFCFLIFGLMIVTLIVPSRQFSENENRVLAQRPDFNIENLLNGKYEDDYETYLSDQFIFREKWIGLKTVIEKLTMKTESQDIYFAKDNYLIEKHTQVFQSDTAQQNITILTKFVDRYKDQFQPNHMSVMLIPNAVDIFQEKLPRFASSDYGRTYLECVAHSLPQNIWFDTYYILQAHHHEELYYRTDHHWKTLAAFYVYQQWLKQMGNPVPEITDYERQIVTKSFEGTIQSKLGIQTVQDTIEFFIPHKTIAYTIYYDDLRETKNQYYDEEALNTKDKYAVFFGGNHSLMSIHTELQNHRKILVIKDSYANCFIPFMIGDFEQIDVIDLRYTNQGLSELIEDGDYTDLLFLYNVSGFAENVSLGKLLY